jgi:hypothetical protein
MVPEGERPTAPDALGSVAHEDAARRSPPGRGAGVVGVGPVEARRLARGHKKGRPEAALMTWS